MFIIGSMGSVIESYSGAEVYISIEMTPTYVHTFKDGEKRITF